MFGGPIVAAVTVPETLREPDPPLVNVPAEDGPTPMDLHEKSRMRAAAYRAKTVYPGPVGELISRELLAHEDFGYRLANGGLVMRLVDHVMKAACPPPVS